MQIWHHPGNRKAFTIRAAEFKTQSDPIGDDDTAIPADQIWEFSDMTNALSQLRDMTVVVATHGTPGVEADREIRLQDGRIIE